MHPRIRCGRDREETWQQNRGRNVDSLKIIQIHDKFYELEATLHNFLVINFLGKSFGKHPSGWWKGTVINLSKNLKRFRCAKKRTWKLNLNFVSVRCDFHAITQ